MVERRLAARLPSRDDGSEDTFSSPAPDRSRASRAALQAIDAIMPLKLRIGLPLWLADRVRSLAATPLCSGLKVDVAVIGGGVSGALVADAMLQVGPSVAAFDRIGFVQGSTPASTAMLQVEIDQPLTLLGQRIGRNRPARTWCRSGQRGGAAAGAYRRSGPAV